MSERYEIRGKLGRGGMSAIYRAYDTVMGREVALKRLLDVADTNLNEASTEALSKEAAALARFQHPNIVTIFAFDEDEDGPYVAMELVDGEDLHQVLVGGALSYDDFKDVARQCLEPLIEAGEQNLLHRDIKPANIMLTLTHSGRFLVKILDFGLAKFSQQPSLQTLDQSGSFLGSIDYIAPEQLELKPLDQRTDLYSLGCVLYYALAQEPPFSGDNPAQTSMNHLKHKCRPIHEFRDDIPELVLDWVMRMISRRREERPDNAVAALRQFEDAVAGKAYEGSAPVQVIEVEDDEPIATPAPPLPLPPASGPVAASPASGSGKVRILTGPVSGPQSPVRATGPRVPATGAVRGNATGSVRGSATGSVASRSPYSPPPPAAPWYSDRRVVVGGGIAALLAVIALIAGISGKEEEAPPPVTTSPAGETPAAETFAELPLPETLLRSDGQPEPPSLPVENGLVGRWFSGKGVFARDYRTRADIEEQVAGWYNLAADGVARAAYRDWEDRRGEFLPRMQRLGPEEIPYANGNYRGVGFNNQSTLTTKNDAFGITKGMTVFLVGEINAGTGTLARFVPKTWDGRIIQLTADHAGNVIGSAKLNPEGPDNRLSLPWIHGNAGVVGYAVDLENGAHRMIARDQPGSPLQTRNGETAEPLAGPYQRFSLGKRGFGDGYSEPYLNVFLEVLVFDRALPEGEMERTAEFLWSRYFKEAP